MEAKVRSVAGITGTAWSRGGEGVVAGGAQGPTQAPRAPHPSPCGAGHHKPEGDLRTAVCQAGALGRRRDGVTSWLGCQCLRCRAKKALPEREVNTQTCFLSLTTFSDLSDHPSQGTRSKWEKQHFLHKGIHRCKSKSVILSSFAP